MELDDWGDFEEIEPEEWERQELHRRQAAEKEIIKDPERDYFEEFRPSRPKLEIGRYVASQGFRVPIVNDLSEWQATFDTGTAMIRSEMSQDYDGFSGLVSSRVLSQDIWLGYDDMTWVSPDTENEPHFHQKLDNLIREGLRSGELSPEEYMRTYIWPQYLPYITEEAVSLGVDFFINHHWPDTSLWRYVEGTNVKVFRDPNVEGRYHFGVQPLNQAVGGYLVDSDKYEKPLQFRKHRQPFIAKPFIDIYEEIRRLPRFASAECPVMELQQDQDGKLYFLQYLKTGHRLNLTEEFELPRDGIRVPIVRGVTGPEGENHKVYIAPRRITNKMHGHGFYLDGHHVRNFAEQYLSNNSSLIIHEAYLSFQDNHFNSAPLYRPPLALALGANQGMEKIMYDLTAKVHGPDALHAITDRNVYVDIHVTSNGREAIVRSDWVPHVEML